jgi:hypothetical protein
MNNKCISKCFDKNTYGLNPSSLNLKKDNNNNFCFDSLFDEESLSTCEINNEQILFPILNLNEKEILKLVYDISSWQDCIEYFMKYKNIINKKTIERIINYSWISFFDTYKVNIDHIIEIYSLYLSFYNIKINKDLIKDKIYELKKLNTIKGDFAKLLFELLKK